MDMLATLLSTENDEGGVAAISLNGMEISAMDCLGYGSSLSPCPKVGEKFSPRFSCLFNEDATWNSVFDGNPENVERLEPIDLWSYRALGKLVAIDGPNTEAKADCGVCILPVPIEVSSNEYLGAYVGFEIVRLSVWRV